MLGEGDSIFGRDFDHILRRELRRTFMEPVIWIEELQTNKIGMCKVEGLFRSTPRVSHRGERARARREALPLLPH